MVCVHGGCTEVALALFWAHRQALYRRAKLRKRNFYRGRRPATCLLASCWVGGAGKVRQLSACGWRLSPDHLHQRQRNEGMWFFTFSLQGEVVQLTHLPWPPPPPSRCTRDGDARYVMHARTRHGEHRLACAHQHVLACPLAFLLVAQQTRNPKP